MSDSAVRPLDDGQAEPSRMCKVSFEVPAWVVERPHLPSEEFAGWVRLAAAIFRYEAGEITLGTAAALAGMGQGDFMHALKQAGRDTFAVDMDDLDRELTYLAERRPPNGAGI